MGYGSINGNLTNSGLVNGTNPLSYLDLTGTVIGTGSYQGFTKFSGLFSPGNNPGQVSLENPYFANTVLLELGGPTAGTQYDQLLITGMATLAGTLNVTLINSFQPTLGDRFVLLSGDTLNDLVSLSSGTFNSFASLPGGELNGAFDVMNLPLLTDPGWQWQVEATSQSLAITVVPEPAVLAFGLGILVLGWRWQSRREPRQFPFGDRNRVQNE